MIMQISAVLVSAASFLYTFYSLCSFMYFLSNFNGEEKYEAEGRDENMSLSILWSLLVNVSLLTIFMLQHSLMAKNTIKQLYSKLDIDELERSIYNLSSAAALHLVLRNWQCISWVTIWDIDTTESNKLWILFTAFHVLGWVIIYSGCLMMDISELAGLKQVYYKLSDRPRPLALKSRELQRYFAHMRHPSFIGFFIILWIHPFMTVDRVLLASILTMYMVLMWNIDEEDYNYHVNIVRRKRIQMS